jgi:CheY-like chemotaxis protein
MENPVQLTRETFLEALRDALKNLYNYDFLRTSPLADIFDIADQFDTSRALQQILTDSINSFKPPPDEPDQSRAWRIFDSLFCCFVQQLKQEIVADQLSISPRQLRREQRAALESLTDYLWRQYNLDSPVTPKNSTNLQIENPELAKELGWVQDLPPSKSTFLQEELPAVLGVTHPLAQQKSVQISNIIPGDLPPLAIHSVVLSQILVNLVIAAVNRATAENIVITAQQVEWLVEVNVKAPMANSDIDPGPNLAIATELTRMSSIQLSIAQDDEAAFCASLLLPIQEQIPVLLVDDNEDALDLFHRYTMGSRYRLISTKNPDEILDLVEKVKPRMIVLDIMMPENNGWVILGMLQNHPLTSEIPVIICTILPQKELALSLGASGFINKPINRQDFLASLNQLSYAGVDPELC